MTAPDTVEVDRMDLERVLAALDEVVNETPLELYVHVGGDGFQPINPAYVDEGARRALRELQRAIR